MIKDNPGMIKVHLSAKCHKFLADQVKAHTAMDFMREYEQYGPWGDMLRGFDAYYMFLLHPIPQGTFIDPMEGIML